MAAFDIVPGLRFVPRNDWSPRDLPRLGDKVPRSRRDRVFIHHTCMADRDATPNIWETEAEISAMMRELQICRREELGADVPYNFVAFMTGAALNDGLYICEGRGEDRSGAHTKGLNTPAIAVSFAGDFEKKEIASADIARRMPLLSRFLGWLRNDPNHEDYSASRYRPMSNLEKVPPKDRNRRVWYHCDVKATDCPGTKLMRHLPDVRFTV